MDMNEKCDKKGYEDLNKKTDEKNKNNFWAQITKMIGRVIRFLPGL